MPFRKFAQLGSVVIVLTLVASTASATNYGITWLDMSPTPFGNSVPNGSVFNLPRVGNVTVTYAIPSIFADNRGQNPLLQNGSVTSGPNSYSWGAHETFGATNLGPNPPFATSQWRITYSFTGTVAANTLYLGVNGLGRTDSFGGGMSTATVYQNGGFLGDWTGGGNYGATQFTPGAGVFTMNNSVSGPGGQDPWWNTALGVVQIQDAVSSLTVVVDQLPGDGVGLNIGYAVPEPSSATLVTLGGLLALRRRR
jgi:hypothetical protein